MMATKSRVFVMISLSVTNKSGLCIEKYTYDWDEDGNRSRTLTKIKSDQFDDDQLEYYLRSKHLEEFDSKNLIHTEGMGIKEESNTNESEAQESADLKAEYLSLSGKEKVNPQWGKKKLSGEVAKLKGEQSK